MAEYNYTLEAICSKPDYAGNMYWAFVYTDANTGKQVMGTIHGGQSNIALISFYLNGESWEPRDYIFTVTEYPIRQFNRLVKGWEYAGCRSDDLAKYITSKLNGG